MKRGKGREREKKKRKREEGKRKREKKRENVKREVKKERRGGRSRLHGDDLSLKALTINCRGGGGVSLHARTIYRKSQLL